MTVRLVPDAKPLTLSQVIARCREAWEECGRPGDVAQLRLVDGEGRALTGREPCGRETVSELSPPPSQGASTPSAGYVGGHPRPAVTGPGSRPVSACVVCGGAGCEFCPRVTA